MEKSYFEDFSLTLSNILIFKSCSSLFLRQNERDVVQKCISFKTCISFEALG